MSIETDPVRVRIAGADPAPVGTEPSGLVMDADALLSMIDQRSGDETAGATPERLAQRVESPRRAVAAFAATFVMVVLVVGGAALLGTRGTNGAVDGNVSTTPAPSSTLAPATTAAPLPTPTHIAWDPVLLTGPGHLYFYQVASDGEHVVAISASSDTAPGSTWISDDGRDWRLMNPSDLSGADPFDGILTAGPDGFLVVGPGMVTPAESQGYTEVAAVASGSSEWVAVGRHELDGRVWVSDDTRSWVRVDDSAFVGASPLDVVAGGPGFVAVGSFHGLGEGGNESAAVWTSGDGRQWRRVESNTLATETRLGSVVVDPRDGSLIAFGSHSVWRSDNAGDWTPIHNRDVANWLSQPSPTADAVWVADTLVAAGGDMVFSLWTSTDRGASWVRHNPDDPVFAGQTIEALIDHAGRLIAVGGDSRARTGMDISKDPLRADAGVGVVWVGEVE